MTIPSNRILGILLWATLGIMALTSTVARMLEGLASKQAAIEADCAYRGGVLVAGQAPEAPPVCVEPLRRPRP